MEMETCTEEVVLSTRLAGKLPELKSIVSVVTCSICYGSVKEPLTTSIEGCGHTFCSICVRGYLTKFKQQCPQCLKEIHDRDLLVNRPLKVITQYIQTLIPKLEELVNGSSLKPLDVTKHIKTESGTQQFNAAKILETANASR